VTSPNLFAPDRRQGVTDRSAEEFPMVWLVYRALRTTSSEIHFRSVRNDSFIQLSKLRQNKSAIPAH
jgi:hypothetical protein